MVVYSYNNGHQVTVSDISDSVPVRLGMTSRGMLSSPYSDFYCMGMLALAQIIYGVREYGINRYCIMFFFKYLIKVYQAVTTSEEILVAATLRYWF